MLLRYGLIQLDQCKSFFKLLMNILILGTSVHTYIFPNSVNYTKLKFRGALPPCPLYVSVTGTLAYFSFL
jgi:hypothetical protein